MFAFVFFFNKSSINQKFISMEDWIHNFSSFLFLCAPVCLNVCVCVCMCVFMCQYVKLCVLFDSIFFSLLNLFWVQIWIHQTSDLILLRIFFNRIVVVVGSTLMNHHVVVERATTLQPAVTACSCCIDSCIWCCHLVLVAKRPRATCQRLPKWLIIH